MQLLVKSAMFYVRSLAFTSQVKARVYFEINVIVTGGRSTTGA